MAKREKLPSSDVEECRDKIKAILAEYNCQISTEDYCWAWVTDLDTLETAGDINPK